MLTFRIRMNSASGIHRTPTTCNSCPAETVSGVSIPVESRPKSVISLGLFGIVLTIATINNDSSPNQCE